MKFPQHVADFINEFVEACEERKGKTPPKPFNDRLRTLGEWAIRRADGQHNERTTRAMLQKKVQNMLGGVIYDNHD